MIRHRYICDLCGRIDELVKLPSIIPVTGPQGIPEGWVQIDWEPNNLEEIDRWKQFCNPKHRDLWLETKRLTNPAAGDRERF